MDDSPAPPAACTVGTRRDRLRCHLETTETVTGQIINGAIVGLIFLRPYQPCPGCGWASHDDDARFCQRCGTALTDP